MQGFDDFRRAHAHGANVGLKLGAFAGPCYVVTANAALDYFGQTVNIASRVQHLAGAGELVIPEELLPLLEPEERVRATEHFEARVKGVECPLRLVRLALAEPLVRRDRVEEARPGA